MGQEKMSHVVARTPDQITVGIDISKDRLDAHLHPEGCVQQFTNDRKGHAKLIAWITSRHPTRIIFEATGAYHRALEMALGKAALPGVKINALRHAGLQRRPEQGSKPIRSMRRCWPASVQPYSRLSRSPGTRPSMV
jgi:transposase